MEDFKRGFTMIEILLVLGIMTILVALIIPQFVGFNRRNMIREEARLVEDGLKTTQNLAASGIQNTASSIDLYRFDLLRGSGDTSGCYRGYRIVSIDKVGGAILETLEAKEFACPVVVENPPQDSFEFETVSGRVKNLTSNPATLNICYKGLGAVGVQIDNLGRIFAGDLNNSVTCSCATACGSLVTPP